MPPVRRRLPTTDPTDPTTRPEEDPPTQAATQADDDDGRELVASSSQRTEGSAIHSRSRGVARGTRVESGDGSRLRVDIPTEWNAPVGPNATKFAGEIGCRVRQDLSSFDYDRWSSLPASEKAPIVTSVMSKYDCLGLPKVVSSVINTKLATSARQHKYRWHTKWQKAVQEHGEAYAREHPPSHCTIDQWTKMIDNVWTKQAFQDKSSKNKVNRSKQTINHACGSRSLPARAHESMAQNEGQLNFVDFFKETHYNAKKKKWSTPDCEIVHNHMINDVETSQAADTPPLTPEEMSTRYLGPRSGVLKGLGMRPSSSIRSTAASGSERQLQEQVTAQQRQLEEQNNRLEEQNRAMEEQQARMEEQRQRMDMMFTWMTSMGYPGHGPPPPPPPPPDGSAGCGLAA